MRLRRESIVSAALLKRQYLKREAASRQEIFATLNVANKHSEALRETRHTPPITLMAL